LECFQQKGDYVEALKHHEQALNNSYGRHEKTNNMSYFRIKSYLIDLDLKLGNYDN